MAQSGCKKRTRKTKISSGKSRVAKARAELRKLKAKMKRYGENAHRWKKKKAVDGLKKEIKRQEKLLARGPKFFVSDDFSKAMAQVEKALEKK
jgi:hypothetical protein